MVKRNVVSSLLLVAPLIACADPAASLHPLFSGSEAVGVSLAGHWEDEDVRLRLACEGEACWAQLRDGDCPDDAEPCALDLRVSFGKLEGALFADFTAVEEVPGSWPVHSFARVDLEDECLSLRVLDRRWVRETLEAQGDLLGHELVNGDVLLTAPTSQLQAVIGGWNGEPRAFSSVGTLCRRVAAPIEGW